MFQRFARRRGEEERAEKLYRLRAIHKTRERSEHQPQRRAESRTR
jgi:hypothetical protein